VTTDSSQRLAGAVASSISLERTAAASDAAPISIVVGGSENRDEWDRFVSDAQSGVLVLPGQRASGYHEWAWRGIVERSFGHRCIYLLARQDDRVVGLLPLVEIRSRLFGRSLTSLPFVNYGGVLSASPAVGRALVDAATEIARERRSRHVELRHIGRQFGDLPCKEHKVAMWMQLGPGLWDQIDRKLRNQVRKAQKSELAVGWGGVERLNDFYAVFARNMRDLGTPVYARVFFDHVLRAFPDRARLIVVMLRDRPIAAALTYRTGNTMEVTWASSIRDYNHLCPNVLMYWHMLESSTAEGCAVFDFGRSTPNEGTFKFKQQWGAEPVALHWEYSLVAEGGLPDQSPKNPKFRMAIAAWQRCPLWLANAIGPRIVRSIP